MRPTYFDLTVSDLGTAKAFFEKVLGWRFDKFEMPYDYYRITTGPDSEAGIDGGIGMVRDAPLAGGRPMTQVTVAVPSVDAAVSGVQAHGGRILEPKMRIPGIGWYATCAEPGGLAFGVIEAEAEPGAAGPAAVPPASAAPGLTDDEQALWARVVELWALSRARDRDRIAAALHPDYVGWDMSAAAPHDRKTAVLSVSAGAPELQDYRLHPFSVKVYEGRTGVVHYAYEASVAAPGAQTMRVTGRWTEVYAKQGEAWIMVAVSGRPETRSPLDLTPPAPAPAPPRP